MCMNTVVTFMPATQSHYQMSDVFKMAGVSFWHRSMRNKIQMSLRCCAWSVSRCTHSPAPHSRQVGEVVGGSRFLSARLLIVLFGALIEDIL